MREVGLPEHAIPLALAFFNIGVEAGQLPFIAAFFALLWTVSLVEASWRAGGYEQVTARGVAGQLALPAAYVIVTLASFWLIERGVAFWV